MNQLENHTQIDSFISADPINADVNILTKLITSNLDSYRFFFYKVGEHWLDFLWKNGFLDNLKSKLDDLPSYTGRMPEILYLMRISEKVPDKVCEIIKEIRITKETFNSEVLEGFLYILSKSSTECIIQIIIKIKDEEWISLMGKRNEHLPYYKKIFAKLFEDKKYQGIIDLAESILSIKSKDDYKKDYVEFISENPFYFDYITNTQVFHYLIKIDFKYYEKALKTTSRLFEELIKLAKNTQENSPFDYDNLFYLYDTNFFELEIDETDRMTFRDDVKNFLAIVKFFSSKLIDIEDKNKSISIFNAYINVLPNASITRELKLYLFSLRPEYFLNELYEEVFKIFEKKEYDYIARLWSPELLKTIKKSFPYFDEKKKRQFVKNVFEIFNDTDEWFLIRGGRLLSVIYDSLNENEINKGKEIFGNRININYTPENKTSFSGFQTVPPTDFSDSYDFNRDVAAIVSDLKDKLSPEILALNYKYSGPFDRFNLESAGRLIASNIKSSESRFVEYINYSDKFFDREEIHPHYTYSYMQGIFDYIDSNNIILLDEQVEKLVLLFNEIITSFNENPVENKTIIKDSFHGWIVDWSGVLSEMADAVYVLLKENNGKALIDFKKFRNQILALIEFLSSHNSSLTGNETLSDDTFTIAINTVRGKAFEAFLRFVYHDDSSHNTESKIKLSPDVKNLFEEILNNESSRYMMFLFGYHLPSFYYRDSKWIVSLFDKIFPIKTNKVLFIGSWEGYLSNNLYKEIFIEEYIQKLYLNCIDTTTLKLDNIKFHKDLDTGISTHLALAYLHYEDFDLKKNLFKQFWENNNVNQHKNFLDKLGRFVTSNNEQVKKIFETSKRSKEKIVELWNYLIEHSNNLNKEIYSAFGHLITKTYDLFDTITLASLVEKTLELSKGALDFDLNLYLSIKDFANNAPNEALNITRLYYLGSEAPANRKYKLTYGDDHWFDAIKILYNNPDTKEETYKLINDLIAKYSSDFWILKDIIKEN